MRDAGSGPAVPVILVAHEGALVVARLDHQNPAWTEDDEREHVAPVARRVARYDDVLGGQSLAQIHGGALREPCPRTVRGDRSERRAESSHCVLSTPRPWMLVAASRSHK